MMTSRIATGDDLPLIWSWIKDERHLHCDDTGPRNIVDFMEFMGGTQDNEYCVVFEESGVLVGAIKFERANRRVLNLRGMVFAPEVRGSGFPQEAFLALLGLLHEDGVRKVSFMIFQHNYRAQRFFIKLGAVVEGILVKQADQNGEPVDLMLFAIHANDTASAN